jgi:c-di-GMP-binding flagellar brake protein YcgR
MEKSTESRREQRFKIHQIVELEMSLETFFSAQGQNLSAGGMRFETGREVEPYSRIFTMLKLGEDEDAPVIRVEGIVMHVAPLAEGFSCGVQFTGMTANDRRILSEYLAAFPADDSDI